MKAITLTQPWATLVAIGAKTIETRSWSTNYRGELAIHAAKGFPVDCKWLCFGEPFRTLLYEHGYHHPDQLPRGLVIATARLVNVRATSDLVVSPLEEALGDFSDGRFGWLLANVQRIEPTAARGSLGLWDWIPQPVPVVP